MKKIMLTAAGLTVVMAIALVACKEAPANEKTTVETAAVPSKEDMIKRGEYLVNTIGCDDCHTPKKFGPQGPAPDMENRFAGHLSTRPAMQVVEEAMKKGWVLMGPELTMAVGPWGTSYAANISSDSTGIGNWTEEQFFKAMREGKYKGLDNSRPLLPPMPWFNFAKLNDEDMKAMFAFLKSTKPVNNVVPAPKAPGVL
ncbi:c-type cytochrome [Flavihumibacter stibioxidans]|uniref:Diheme cytochrome c-553 n=1 Tax=Flavihumibacter stibioxidans TaxID=1834163 RepID=A0ABR7M3U4_9BACT|nr:c-type cytochrome [Flavihumibacter stibioxidans]MBC6489693.1 diheme cytochrome c-553 [Flavihumibacter stibioxidans]